MEHLKTGKGVGGRFGTVPGGWDCFSFTVRTIPNGTLQEVAKRVGPHLPSGGVSEFTLHGGNA